MSKQLTLSATVAVLSMAVFALSTSVTVYDKTENSARTASAQIVGLTAAQ